MIKNQNNRDSILTENDYDYYFKIIILGDSSVGKSNILSKFTRNEFNLQSKATIGVEMATRVLEGENNRSIKAEIWDTVGQEKYSSIMKAFYRSAVGALLVYDITNKKSFQNIEKWLNQIREQAGENCQVLLVGNKTDMKNLRQVDVQEAEHFAKENNLSFIETSAYDGQNIELAFQIIFQEALKQLTLEKQGKLYTEEKKDDILTILATNTTQNFNFKDFKFIQKLGQGASGSVEKVVHQPTNQFYALKKIHYVDNEILQKHLSWEVKTLFTSESDQIVKYFGAYYKDSTVHIVQEFMQKGSLDKVLAKTGKISDVILGEITLQILLGLAYLHKTLKIIHRDIKPANILINQQGQVKIADLGICGKIENTLDQRKTWVGTVGYMSPERLKGEPYTNNTDIWSLGLLLLECILGKNPLTSNENGAFFDVLKQIDEFQFPKLPETTSKNFTEFLQQCLLKDPYQRPTAEQLLQHKFIKKFSSKRDVVQAAFLKWLETV